MRSIRSRLLREDRICPWWLAYTFDNPLRRFFHDPAKLFGGLVLPGMTVADIGCGLGYFTLAFARMVGREGCVIAADIQQEMLDTMMKRAGKAGVAEVIRPVLSRNDDIGFREPVDFLLAFWMAHEVEDGARFFRQVHSVLKDDGSMLMAEPLVHVSSRRFEESMDLARRAGFLADDPPRVRFSRAALLRKR